MSNWEIEVNYLEWLDGYVRLVADALGLTDWTIRVERRDDEECTAECAAIYGRRYATIRFDSEFFAVSPEEQRVIVIHELLHCHHAPVDELIHHVLPTVMAPPQHEMFVGAYRINMERFIDPVAVVIAGLGAIPLPPPGSDGFA